jgi:hypothetical protein
MMAHKSRTLLLGLAIVLASVVAAAAQAAKTPKELRGGWCNIQNRNWDSPNRSIYKRCSPWPAGDFDDVLEVGVNKIDDNDQSDRECKLLRIASIGRGRFIVRMKCRDEASDPWKYITQRWRLFANGQRLKITTENKSGHRV